MSKPQDVKRKLLGLSPDPGTPVLTAKKSGTRSPGPSSFRNTKESPLQKEVPTRQSPRKHRGGCKTSMLSSTHFLCPRERGRERVRFKGTYATYNRDLCHIRAIMLRYAGHFLHVGHFGNIEQGISVSLGLFCHEGSDPTDDLNLPKVHPN